MKNSAWPLKAIGDVCEIKSGLWTGKKAPFRRVKVIRNTNFSKNCELDLNDVAEIDVESKQFDGRSLQRGDLIIEKSGGSPTQPVGRVVLFDLDEADYSYSNFTSRLRILNKNEILPEYLWYALKRLYVQGAVLRYQTQTSGIRNLKTTEYLQTQISIPPISIQTQIVSILNAATELKKKRKEADQKMSVLASANFYKMFGDPAKNDKGWPTMKLGDICKFTGGGTPSKSNKDYWSGVIPWVSPKDMTKDLIDDAEDHITDRAISESATSLLPIGTVLIVTRSGILKHHLPIAITRKPLAINQDLKGLVVKDTSIAKEFFVYQQLAIRSSEILSLVKSGVTVQSINTESLKNLTFVVPPIDLQEKFEECFFLANTLSIKQSEIRNSLRMIFDGLLDEYVWA